MGRHPRFAGKVAVVTGSGSGIGRSIIRKLIDEEASVLAAARDLDSLNAFAADVGGRCATMKIDVASEHDNARMVAAAVERFGKIDLSFNVAGTTRPGTILTQSEQDWDFSFDICLKGPFFSMKHVARHMISAGTRGAIVNVASLNADMPGWGLAAYSAAKAGLEMLSRSGAIEFADHGIRVNTVSPGLTQTPSASAMPAPMIDAFLERIPMRRPGQPGEQADACLFLASEEASYITGANLVVDGGWSRTGYPDMRPYYAEPDAADFFNTDRR